MAPCERPSKKYASMTSRCFSVSAVAIARRTAAHRSADRREELSPALDHRPAVASIRSRSAQGSSRRLRARLPGDLLSLIMERGGLAAGAKEVHIRAVEQELQGDFSRDHDRRGRAPADIEAAQALQIVEGF